jgi:hypothetical protein
MAPKPLCWRRAISCPDDRATRVIHARDGRMRCQASTTAAAFSACTRMRACSVRTPRSVMKLSNGAPVTPMAFAHQASARAAPGRGDHGAADDIAVAVQILGGGVHHQVRAERERLLPERREKRVVDHRPARRPHAPHRRWRGCRRPRSSGLLGVSIHTSFGPRERALQRGGIALIDEVDHEIALLAARPAAGRCRHSNRAARARARRPAASPESSVMAAVPCRSPPHPRRPRDPPARCAS